MGTRIVIAACSFLLVAGCSDRSPRTPVAPAALETFALAGTVIEQSPDRPPGPPVAGARVEALAKPGIVAAATTDASGSYRIEGVAGSFQIRITKRGYDVRTVDVAAVTAPRTVDVTLQPIPRTLLGVITETEPTELVPVAGARITVVTGANAGVTATTDIDGRYVLESMWGEFDIRVERSGYDPSTIHVVMTGEDRRIDVRLQPVARDVIRTFGAEHTMQVGPLRVGVQVHSAGELAIIDWDAYGFEEGDTSRLQIWEDGRLLAETVVERSFPRRTTALRAPVVPGRTYEVRGIPFFWWYTATIRHPY